MVYISPPPPSDDTVLFEVEGRPYTYGEHRQMSESLAELEASDPGVAAARRRLDEALETAGIHPETQQLICSHCWRPADQPHEPECPDHVDPIQFVTREAGGYQYLDDRFHIVETTSVPMTDEEALEYFGIVQLMFPAEGPEFRVTYILKREMNEYKYKMMPWQFDKDTWEVYPIEQSS